MRNIKESGRDRDAAERDHEPDRQVRARSRSLLAMIEDPIESPAAAQPGLLDESDGEAANARAEAENARGGAGNARAETGHAPGEGTRGEGGPRTLDGVSSFMGLRWEDPQTVRMTIRPELINGGGLLSGVATYAMVDYCMGSTLWVQTTHEEHIATISISINYIQTATAGEVVCRTTLDRRNRRTAVMRSEVHHEDGRLLVTAIGSYSIFPARRRLPSEPER